MIFSIPYIILIILFGALAFYYESLKAEEDKRMLDFLCMAIYIFFFGFRGFICDDWQNYYTYFQQCSIDNLKLNIFVMTDEWNYEAGFTLLNIVCKTIYDDFQLLVFVCTCINAVLLYRFLKKYTDNVPLGMLLFLCMGGLIMSVNLMRNTISILIFANSLEFITQRKPLPYFLCCLLAFLFHLSSLIFIPLYFILHKKCNKYLFIGIFFTGIILFLSHVPFVTWILTHTLGLFDEKLLFLIEGYTDSDEESKLLSIGFLERVLTGTLILCYYDKLTNIRKENSMFINLFVIYVSCSFYFAEFDELSLRLSNLFILCYWVLWGDLLKCFYFTDNKRLYIAYLSIYCILKIAGHTKLPTWEYDNVLFGAKSYNERIYIHEHYSKPK